MSKKRKKGKKPLGKLLTPVIVFWEDAYINIEELPAEGHLDVCMTATSGFLIKDRCTKKRIVIGVDWSSYVDNYRSFQVIPRKWVKKIVKLEKVHDLRSRTF